MAPANRNLAQRMTWLIGLTMALLHLYWGLFGNTEPYLQRVIHLLFGMVLTFLVYGRNGQRRTTGLGLVDSLWLVTAVVTLGYLLVRYDYLVSSRFPFVDAVPVPDQVLGVLFLLVLLEATRRLTGWVLPLMTAAVLGYVFAGPYLPGILGHGGFELGMLVDVAYLTSEGVFGIPLGASATYIILFVLFGSLLERSGLGNLLMDVSSGLAGRAPGGPAKVAVVSSALLGTISGSAVSNVLTTGMITIPLMKRTGYPAAYAGAVEAVASTGGQIMPPVMGVVAFLMAEYTGIPYIKITAYALMPAVLYYLGVFAQVHLQAKKLGLRGLKPDELPNWRSTFRSRWHLLLPIVLMLTLMAMDYSPTLSVTWSIVGLVVVAQLSPATRLSPGALLGALVDGAKSSALVVLTTAAAGAMIGAIGLTGIGLRFTTSVFDLAGDNLLLALVCIAVASVVLGIGLPPSATYIIQVATTIPVLVKILQAQGVGGDALVAAHMFVMYYANLAVLTPPDAMASFAAASLAEADPMRVGVIASRLALVAYLIPFMFVLSPSLLMIGPATDVVAALVTATAGVVILAMGLEGYCFGRMGVIGRAVTLVAGLFLMKPGLLTDSVGLALAAGVIGYYWHTVHRRKETVSSDEATAEVR